MPGFDVCRLMDFSQARHTKALGDSGCVRKLLTQSRCSFAHADGWVYRSDAEAQRWHNYLVFLVSIVCIRCVSSFSVVHPRISNSIM